MTHSQKLRTILVCQNCTCLSRGAAELLAAFQAEDLPEDVEAIASDCLGQCNLAPSARIVPEETWYCRLKREDVTRIVKQHLNEGKPVEDKLHPRIHLYHSQFARHSQ